MILTYYTTKELQNILDKSHAFNSANLKEDSEGFSYSIDLPGIIKDDLSISQDGKKISIKAIRKFGNSEKSYSDAFILSRNCEDVKASLSNGVLSLQGQWKESDKPKQIEVVAS